ncbi:MAG: phytanoyl-CoA dioxygenase family protein [Kiloniellales bacterium]|nr:phytanoyl-CoA dioxygenase family protein [Kiloniellales bacterium]
MAAGSGTRQVGGHAIGDRGRSGHVVRFHEQGYAVIRSVFTPSEIEALAEAFDRIYALAVRDGEDMPAVLGHPEVGFRAVTDPNLGRICRIATWPAYIDSVLDRIRVDRRMLAILEPLIGRSLKQITSQLHWKPPGAERVEFGFHQDIRFRRPRGAYRNTDRSFIQTALAVDPHRADSGAIRLYPGSHRLGDLLLGGEGPVLDQELTEADLAARGLDPAELVDIELDPGDVALWGLFTVHGSGLNRADHSRRVYINGYVTSEDCDLGTWAFRDGEPCPLITA